MDFLPILNPNFYIYLSDPYSAVYIPSLLDRMENSVKFGVLHDTENKNIVKVITFALNFFQGMCIIVEICASVVITPLIGDKARDAAKKIVIFSQRFRDDNSDELSLIHRGQISRVSLEETDPFTGVDEDLPHQ